MKARNALSICGAALSCVVLASCGGDRHGASMPPPPPPPPPPMTMDLDTAAVLAIVRTKTSDTADPFQVDNGAVAVTPVGDETSSPISVDAT
jgi:hypothetical protein